ncbi:MAG: cell division protein FtsA [Elusimicrobia bacterium]|nr:cell division protein FtsA [Elusimicrobiota bacterium]
MDKNVFLSLDLGTNSIHGVFAKYNDENQIEILSAETFVSEGVKCGAISDISAAEYTVDKFLTKAENEYNLKEVKLVCAIRGSQIEVFSSEAGLALKNSDDTNICRVTEETISDIRNRLEEANKLPENKETIEIIPQQYKLDDQEVINPERMGGKYLELSAVVVTGLKSYLTNIRQATGGDILRYGYTAIANTLVSKEDKEYGCILVDIGGMTTGVVVYVEGKLKHAFELNFGSDYVTRDILKKLRITLKEAKAIKEQYGYILEDLITKNTEFEYSVLGNQKQKYTVKDLVDIIKPQVELQLREINSALLKRGVKADELVGGFLLTGGGSLLKGMPEAFSKYFSTNAKCVNFVHDDFVYSQEKKENFDSVINSQVYTSCFAILKNKTKNLMDNDYAEGEEEQEEESVYEDEDGESVSTTKKILKKIQAAIKAFKKNS